jgi:predicted SAM-dependent methyltransferase
MNDRSAVPAAMRVDPTWAKTISLSNFTNAYQELADVESIGGVRRILLIGVGQGLEPAILRWRGYEVTTFDIDPKLKPDETGSVHDLSRFEDGAFDVAIASHVLEHLPVRLLDPAIAELARVARHALVYLPVYGAYLQIRVQSNFRALDWSLLQRVKKPFSRPDPEKPLYMGGEHYWEIGVSGFSFAEVRTRFQRSFNVVREYRNPEWLVSYNFVLRSQHEQAQT